LVQKTTILNMYLGTMIGKIQRSRGAPSCHSTTFTSVSKVRLKETTERWPLPTIETEVNGDSGSPYEMGPSLVGSLGLSCQYKRFLSCLDCPSKPNSKYFHRTLFQFVCPHCPASWASSRVGSPVS
jgi:hypothetical protein